MVGDLWSLLLWKGEARDSARDSLEVMNNERQGGVEVQKIRMSEDGDEVDGGEGTSDLGPWTLDLGPWTFSGSIFICIFVRSPNH